MRKVCHIINLETGKLEQEFEIPEGQTVALTIPIPSVEPVPIRAAVNASPEPGPTSIGYKVKPKGKPKGKPKAEAKEVVVESTEDGLAEIRKLLGDDTEKFKKFLAGVAFQANEEATKTDKPKATRRRWPKTLREAIQGVMETGSGYSTTQIYDLLNTPENKGSPWADPKTPRKQVSQTLQNMSRGGQATLAYEDGCYWEAE
jgi:hypothetical protein